MRRIRSSYAARKYRASAALIRALGGREDQMADDRAKRGAPDRSRINLGEDYEVEYWSKTLGVSRERLVEAVKKVGDSLQAVRRELGDSA